jgi:hypothetical protein
MTKQEKIQEVYGESWDSVKEYVDINGWFSTKDVGLFDFPTIDVQYDIIGNLKRPKSLQGIEKHNL